MSLTLKEIADYIEQNGLPQTREGEYIVYGSDGPIEACAIGMAAINADVTPFEIDMALNKGVYGLSSVVVDLNDLAGWSFKKIADYIRKVDKAGLLVEVDYDE